MPVHFTSLPAPPRTCQLPYLRLIYEPFWASLVAQLVKNLPARQETMIRLLGWEDPLEKGQAAHSSLSGLPWWLRW